ncbi:MAG: biotin/lipoyl-containing protein [Candidatus Kapaibacteriales bacterium]
MLLSYKNRNYECELIGEILRVNQQEIPFALNAYSENIFKIKIGNDEKIVYVASDEKNFYAFIDGEQYIFSLVTEETKETVSSFEGNKFHEEIKPPMPGSVVKVLVEEGQEVGEGAPIVIVEAMKMEITLYSSISGKISKINVKQAEQVDTDQVLVEIKKN